MKNIIKKLPGFVGVTIEMAFFASYVLFGGEQSWSEKGITDLAQFIRLYQEAFKKQNPHFKLMKLTDVGRVNIATQLDSAYRHQIRKKNEQVDKNRYVLSKIIDCIKFCGVFELALRGHDECDGSLNPGIFRGLIDVVGSLDSVVKDHNI